MSEPPPPPQSPPPPPTGPPPGWQQPPGWQPPPAPGWQQPGWQQPGPAYGAVPQQDGTAVAALVLAIASFVVCPLVPAIVALVLAHQSQQKIAASGGRLTGEGLNQAARIIAWVHLGLLAFVVVIIIVIAAAGGFDSDNDNDFDIESIRTVGSYLAARFS